tara:strand:+ start:282 stop:464 length:183 start_codon:yes stop_codon:yes gene_type:complete
MKTEKITTDEVSKMHATSMQISKKIRENILSGRWDPVTPAERQMKKEHLEKLKTESKKKK